MLAGSSNSVLRQLSLSKRLPTSYPHSPWKNKFQQDEEEKRSLGQLGECESWHWDWSDTEWMVSSQKTKKVMVVVDGSPECKIAMLWALFYLVDKVDTLLLFHVFHKPSKCKCKPDTTTLYARGYHLVNSLRAHCRSRRPKVEVEGMVVEGDKGRSIVSYAKKLRVSVLILGQRKPSIFHRFFGSKRDELIEYCIGNTSMECLTMGVRKQSKGMGGYIINSRWHKDFWLLA